MIERPIIKTHSEVNRLLDNIHSKEDKIKSKLSELNDEKKRLTDELNELNVKLVEAEIEGDKTKYNKISKKIEEQEKTIGLIEQKIYAYTQYKDFNCNDADSVFALAAYEYNDNKNKYEETLNTRLDKLSNDIEKEENKLKELKKEKEDILYELYTAKPFEGIGNSVVKILPYLSTGIKKEINKLLDNDKVFVGDEGIVINKYLKENYDQIKQFQKQKSSIIKKLFNSTN